jgi:hypothetical protein
MPICNATTKAGTPCQFAARDYSTKCGHHTNWTPPPPRCVGVTKAGTQCTRDGFAGEDRCRQHRDTEHTIRTIAVAALEQCSHVTRGKRCRRIEAVGNALHECERCAHLRARRLEHERRVTIYNQIRNVYWTERRAAGIEMPLENDGHAVFEEINRCSMLAYRSLNIVLGNPTEEQIAAAAAGFPARPDAVTIAERNARIAGEYRVAPQNSLAAIAASSQSVHTRAVIDQSNRGVAFILAVPVPEDQNTLADLKALWADASEKTTHTDIKTWWDKSLCFSPGDYMYRRLLKGVWAFIKSQDDAERRSELETRLLQECREARGMCCQGHTNRLVNVLSGFVGDIQVEQSRGEILQQEFAEIGGIEDEEARYLRATQVIADLGLNADEAGPWLDAIAN